MEYTPKSWLEKDGNMIIDPLGFGVPMGSLFLDTANSVGKQQQLAIQFPQLTYIYISTLLNRGGVGRLLFSKILSQHCSTVWYIAMTFNAAMTMHF